MYTDNRDGQCPWSQSVMLYAFQGFLYLAYLLLFVSRWVSLQPTRHHRRMTIWKVIGEIGLLIVWTVGGYGVDALFTTLLDGVLVGWECAIVHCGKVLGTLAQIMTIILYMGWKIVLAVMLWDRHPAMIEALGFLFR